MQNTIDAIKAMPIYAIIVFLGSACAAIAGFPRLVNAILELAAKRNAKAIADQIYRDSGVASFTSEDIAHSRRNYIAPSCMQTDPANEDDSRTVVALGPLFKTIDDHFEAGGPKRHVILLADSGMGKTSFCINYYAREIKKRKSKRRRIAVISLGRENAVDEIKRFSDKRNAICFLDAFDEDHRAVGDPDGRLAELMNAAADFRNVVVTCRSQFFADDAAVPVSSGIMYVAARKAGQSRELPLHRLFLAPFSAKQIQAYLAKQFPLTSLRNWRFRREALALVTSISELSTRPMLLELLPDLVRDGRSITELFGLYEFLVEKWLERESDWISPSDLRDISIELAVRCYHLQRSGHGDRIAPSILEEIAEAHSAPLETWKLKSRSLLNRDIEGQFKFAHRSVLEYLFLLAALKGDARCYSVEWTDLMKDLLVSWGSSDPSGTYEKAALVLQLDHSATGLFPLASPLAQPALRSAADCRKALKGDGISFRQSRRIPVTWRHRSLQITCVQSSDHVSAYKVYDSTNGISWFINDVSRILGGNERDIYRDRRYQVGVQTDLIGEPRIDSRRLPSIEEMLSLWESEPFLVQEHGFGAVLDKHEIYWLGDSGDNGPLCCSFGEVFGYPYLRLLCSKGSEGRHIHIYELQNRYGYVDREPFKAMAVYVIDAD
ncbi:putative NACHT domain protein [Luteimonas sp. 9C]|uniref:NACHT domain-containing protein n=1 Tax=Luteimonas sp. 9C TaxID=2653148 RepID=UPI0012F10DDB|nr:hypothetical protein [Luteimonas sp. 9C]VXB00572.1 putative NACHT domain protein [Luteimonas sp. 9C]